MRFALLFAATVFTLSCNETIYYGLPDGGFTTTPPTTTTTTTKTSTTVPTTFLTPDTDVTTTVYDAGPTTTATTVWVTTTTLPPPASSCTYYGGSGIEVTNNYVTNANMQGYGFGYVDSFANPSINCTGTLSTLCMNGALAADTTFSTIAGLGFNLNQAQGAGTSPNALPTTVSSVTVAWSGTSTDGVRAQVSVGTTFYCATLTNSPQTFVAAAFNTACWDGAGTAWDGTGATAFQLIVPATNTTATTITDLCLDSVAFQ